MTFLPTWEVKRRGIEEGGQSVELMAKLTGRLASCDQQVVGDQVSHVTGDADKTGLNSKTCSVYRVLV